MRFRNLLLGSLAALFLWTAPVVAQVLDFGNITATNAACTATSCVSIAPGEASSITWQVSGTFSATLAFEATADGTNWVALQVQNAADGTISTSTTAAGAFSFTNNGYLSVRVRASAYASGTAVVYATRGYGTVRWQGFSSVTVNPGPITVTSNSLGTTSFRGFLAQNTTAAAAGAQQHSPMGCWKGNGWKTDATAASQSVEFCWEVQPVQGTSAPSGNFILKSSINGGAFSTVGTFTIAGAFTSVGGIQAGTGFINAAASAYQWDTRTRLNAASDGNVRIANQAVTNTYDITLADWGTTLSCEGVSVADAGLLFMGAGKLGRLVVTGTEGNELGQFQLNGTGNSTSASTDNNSTTSATKDTASRINVYYDAAGASGAGYYIQNMRGATRTIRACLIGV